MAWPLKFNQVVRFTWASFIQPDEFPLAYAVQFSAHLIKTGVQPIKRRCVFFCERVLNHGSTSNAAPMACLAVMLPPAMASSAAS